MSSNYCSLCQPIVDQCLAVYSSANPVDSVAFDLYNTYADLEASANQGCAVCAFIRRELFVQELKPPSDVASQDGWFTFNITSYKPLQVVVGAAVRSRVLLKVYEKGADLTLAAILTAESVKHALPGFRSDTQSPTWPNPRPALRFNESAAEIASLVQHWFSTCSQKHQNCQRWADSASKELPTRLIDVSPNTGDQDSVRLIKTSEAFPLQPNPDSIRTEATYVTLSYCWGPGKHAASTTPANFNERLVHMSLQALPQTFKDAILVTRSIGVRYIWIDALCIIQPVNGDTSDWEREFPLMGQIYRKSVFTIAASGAASNQEGLFGRREAVYFPVGVVELTNAKSSTKLYLNPQPPDWYHAVEYSPLSKRGWVLQERILAARTIYWTDVGIFWGCRELQASEFEPEGLSDGRSAVLRADKLIQELSSASYKHDSGRTWFDLVVDFTSKNLTNMSDRLPAMAGLSNAILERTDDLYLEGIWQSNLTFGLAWSPIRSHTRAGAFQLPRVIGAASWSWASVEAAVKYDADSERGEFEAAVKFIEVMSEPSAMKGASTKSTMKLRLRAEVGSLPLKQRSQDGNPFESGGWIPASRKEDASDNIYFDTISDSTNVEADKISYLLLYWVKSGKTRTDGWVLLVTPVGDKSNEYKRIGCGTIYKFEKLRSWAARKREITLV